MASIQNFPFQLEQTPRSRGAVGLVLPATNTVIEEEFGVIFRQAGMRVHHSRIPIDVAITKESLAAMEDRLEGAVGLILPGRSLDVVAYGCTSASMVIGTNRITEICQMAKPGVHVTNPFTAAIFGLKLLKVTAIALVTPYLDDINQQMRAYLENEGIRVKVMISFNEVDNYKVGQMSLDSVENAVLEVAKRDDVEGVFISCTNLRSVDRIESLEKKLDKPVTSSNHAMAWHAMYLAGVGHSGAGWGRLYEQTPKTEGEGA